MLAAHLDPGDCGKKLRFIDALDWIHRHQIGLAHRQSAGLVDH
jgi:hypothetical protein